MEPTPQEFNKHIDFISIDRTEAISSSGKRFAVGDKVYHVLKPKEHFTIKSFEIDEVCNQVDVLFEDAAYRFNIGFISHVNKDATKEVCNKEEPKQELPIVNGSYGCTIQTKKETLEEAAKRLAKNHCNNRTNTNTTEFQIQQLIIKGAKWQQERMYSEEDMKNAFDSAREFNSLDGIVDVHIVLPMGGDMSDLQPLYFTFEEWFEQFKKK